MVRGISLALLKKTRSIGNPCEIELLSYLAQHSDRPVSREELLTKVWGYARNLDIETRTVDIHIAKIRRKIETDPKEPENLITVRGAGYRLVTEG